MDFLDFLLKIQRLKSEGKPPNLHILLGFINVTWISKSIKIYKPITPPKVSAYTSNSQKTFGCCILKDLKIQTKSSVIGFMIFKSVLKSCVISLMIHKFYIKSSIFQSYKFIRFYNGFGWICLNFYLKKYKDSNPRENLWICKY